MNCPFCGTKITDAKIFCDNCGRRIDFEKQMPSQRNKRMRSIILIIVVAMIAVSIVGVVKLILLKNEIAGTTEMNNPALDFTPPFESISQSPAPAIATQAVGDFLASTPNSTYRIEETPAYISAASPTPSPRINNLGTVKYGLESGVLMLRDGYSTAAKSIDSLSAGTQVSLIRKIMWRENGKVIQKFYEVEVVRSSERGYVLCSGIDTEYDDVIPHKYVDGTPPTPTPRPTPKPIATITPSITHSSQIQTETLTEDPTIQIVTTTDTPLEPNPGISP